MVVEGEYYDGPCKLLELPHYVMRILFSYLDATSLYQLSRTCNYLKEFILDPLLWKYIDARDEPNIFNKIEYCTQRIHKKTAHFCIKGNLTFHDLPANFFNIIKPFENIKVLALENVKIRGSKVTLRNFPSGLEELSLRRTHVTNSDYFFQHSVKNIPKLRVLILDECFWVTCSFLLSVSKYEHLEIISVVKCLRVHRNMIPYLSVAKLGCKNLKIFDCRFTGIGSELLRTFYSKENLQRLYFQSFKSAEVDYHENILDLSKSGRKHAPELNTDMSIADTHLCEYVTTTAKAKTEIDKISHSVLYKDPYPDCVCGEGARDDGLTQNIILSDEDMIHMSPIVEEHKFLCRKHMKHAARLPGNFKAFFLSQKKFDPDIHSDLESTSDEEDDDNSCCYFGMGSRLIVPTPHDRTPSVGEEMTLPEEGARNLHCPRVDIQPAENLEDIRECANNSPGPSRNYTLRRSPAEYKIACNPFKRSYGTSDEDEDLDKEQRNKKLKKNNNASFDGVSNEAQEALINDLVESIDDVSSRIDKIVEAGSSNLNRSTPTRPEPDCQPSTSRAINGISHPKSTETIETSKSSINDDLSVNNSPSCSKSKISNSNKNGSDNSVKNEDSIGRSRNEIDGIRPYIPFYIPLLDDGSPEVRIFAREIDQERWKIKWKIPLKRLSLRGYKKITDCTLSYLKNLDIELIDLTYTSVTKVGIDNFLVHNPNCRVIHPLYCICKPKLALN